MEERRSDRVRRDDEDDEDEDGEVVGWGGEDRPGEESGWFATDVDGRSAEFPNCSKLGVETSETGSKPQRHP